MGNYNFSKEQRELLLALLHEALEPSLIEEKKDKFGHLPLLKQREKSYLFEPEFQHYNVEIGEFYDNHGQWDLSVEHFERAIEIDPCRTVAIIKLAIAYLHLGNLDKGRECFEKCNKLLPGNSIIKGVMAYIKFYQGYEREGINTIRELISEEAENVFFRYLISEIYITWHQYDLAVEEITRVLSVTSGTSEAHLILGRIYRDKRDFDLAIKHLKISIEMAPDVILAYNALGDIYLSMKDYEPAYIYYTKVVELKSGYGDAYNKLGLICTGRGELDAAITYYKKAIHNSPYNKEYLSNISLAYLDKGYLDKVLEHYEKMSGLKSADIDFYEKCVDFFKRNDRLEPAVEICLKNLEGTPGNLQSINVLAELYRDLGNYEMACGLYEKAIAIDPDGEWKYALHTGDILLKCSTVENALVYYFRALELKEDPLIHSKLATVLETYRLDLAVKHYRELLKSDVPNEGYYYYNIATVYLLQHSLDNAMVHYKLAMTLDRRRETLCQYFIGNCALKLGNLDLARNLMEKFILTEPDMATPHYVIGLIKEKLGETNKALWYYKKAMEKDLYHFRAKYRTAILFYKKGDKKGAMEYFLSCFDTPLPLEEKSIEELEDFIMELGKENPDFLLNALKSPSPYIRLNTAKFLAKMGDIKGALELLDFFVKDRKSTGSVKDLLKGFRNKLLVEKLKEIISDGSLKEIDMEAMAEIILLLGDIAHKSFIPLLLNIVKKEHNILKSAAISSLVRMKQEDLLERLSQQTDSSDRDVRTSAIRAIGKLRDKNQISFLFAFLNDKDPEIRSAAISAAGEISHWKSLNFLVDATGDDNIIARREAGLAIKHFCSRVLVGKNIKKKVVKALLKLMDDEDFMVRLNSIEALEFVPAYPAVPSLINCLKDVEYHIRAKAAEVLGVIGNRKAVEPLINALDDFYPVVRAKAAKALGEIKDISSAPVLIYVLKNDFYRVRKEAAVSLGKIKAPEAIEPLCSLLSDVNIRDEVISSLGKIGQPSLEVKNMLLKLWFDCTEMEKITLAETLFKMGEKDKKKFVLKATVSKRENLRKKALEALKSLNEEDGNGHNLKDYNKE